MIDRPDLALDLPLRLLIRQTDHRVELVSTGPSALLERHGLTAASAAPLTGINAIVTAAAGSGPYDQLLHGLPRVRAPRPGCHARRRPGGALRVAASVDEDLDPAELLHRGRGQGLDSLAVRKSASMDVAPPVVIHEPTECVGRS
jgi:hypothetical protein